MVLWIQSSLRKRGRKGNQNLHSKKRGKICYLFSIYKWNSINQNKTIKQYIKIIIYSFCLPESFNTNISHQLFANMNIKHNRILPFTIKCIKKDLEIYIILLKKVIQFEVSSLVLHTLVRRFDIKSFY